MRGPSASRQASRAHTSAAQRRSAAAPSSPLAAAAAEAVEGAPAPLAPAAAAAAAAGCFAAASCAAGAGAAAAAAAAPPFLLGVSLTANGAGLSVIAGFGSGGSVPGGKDSSNALHTADSRMVASMSANPVPMHTRGPAPNGM